MPRSRPTWRPRQGFTQTRRYAECAVELAPRIDTVIKDEAAWKPLDNISWTVIPFGTGGRRGTSARHPPCDHLLLKSSLRQKHIGIDTLAVEIQTDFHEWQAAHLVDPAAFVRLRNRGA
ncbi:MAG: hypothetical protein HQ464_13745, partial [Planctomycetes bacterium]|nr:hypothetical protein [Planctomycetota bacterium]